MARRRCLELVLWLNVWEKEAFIYLTRKDLVRIIRGLEEAYPEDLNGYTHPLVIKLEKLLDKWK